MSIGRFLKSTFRQTAFCCTLLTVIIFQGAGLSSANDSNVCGGADPTSFEDVFRCISTFRHEDGTHKFSRGTYTHNCFGMWLEYKNALIEDGIKHSELDRHKPDCSLFAQAVYEITGRPAFWSDCVNYNGTTEEYTKKCLETFIPMYYSRGVNKEKALKNAGDCRKLARDYEMAVRFAAIDRELPSGFTPLPCGIANKMRVTWNPELKDSLSPCRNYHPGRVDEHLEKCLNMDKRQLSFLKGCIQVRTLYEKKLKKRHMAPCLLTIECCGVVKLR